MIRYKGQLKEYQFNIYKKRKRKKNGKEQITQFSESILTFDIEVTSAWIDKNGDIIPYIKGRSAEYWNSLTPLSLPYIWQFSCDGVVYYGRELRDFENVLKDLPEDVHFIIWVHNLAYEFAHLVDFLEVKEVFARAPHKPMKCVFKGYENVEFRCSYILTRLSLASWGEQLGLPKMVGDLDYEKIRTPLTELTDAELGYCERDCLVVEKGIQDYIKRYQHQKDIPLTQTGTVRRVVKSKLCDNQPQYIKAIKKLVPHDAQEYADLKAVFAGGYTHANRLYQGEVVQGLIQHYDFASSYPTVLIAYGYPSTPWVYYGHEIPPTETFEEKAYILKLTFYNITCITFNTYIQSSKCSCTGGRYDNGRVIHADELTITITEQDYLTIIETYKFDKVVANAVYESNKGYLPRPFCEYILELYENKTSLKGVNDDLYAQSKQYINSLFGMSVTSIIQADVIYAEGEWTCEPLTVEKVNEKLKSLRTYNPYDKRYFLSYSWGCWCTAYARRNLWRCILSLGHEETESDVLYCDTDSIFILGEHDFSWYNEDITNKLKKACKENHLDFEKTHPKTPKGVEKPLGIFTKEPNCVEFRTLGAKRYCERREYIEGDKESDGQLHITVSGINKGAVAMLQDDINNFADGFDFDKDHESVTKKLSTYLVDMPTVKYPDGYISTYTCGINMRRTGYKLELTDEYKAILSYGDLTAEELTEETLVMLRGIF